ncbi:hypothetical protein AAG906_007748 [Vitis piasezkii]
MLPQLPDHMIRSMETHITRRCFPVTGSYDAVYGNPKNKELLLQLPDHMMQSTETPKNKGMLPQSPDHMMQSYGNPRDAGESSIDAGKASPTASYRTVYGNPRKASGSTDINADILNQFSVKENSAEAKIIQKTIEECEKSAIEGVEKYCARSLESLIDFSTSKLGKNIRALPNVVEGEIQEYKFGEGAKMLGEKSVVCHQLNYPYAVALCHAFHMTKIYKVPLVGADGTRVQALAVCHEDTSIWDPNALAFQVLKAEINP